MAECSSGPGKGLRCWNPNMRSKLKSSSGSSIIQKIKDKAAIAKANREEKRSSRMGDVEEPIERDFPGDIAPGVKKKEQKASRWLSQSGGYKFVKGGIKKK